MGNKEEKIKLDYKSYIFLILFLIVFVVVMTFVFDKSLAEDTNQIEQIDAHEYNMSHLDQIEEYTIKVVPRSDGTLDMVYHIKWRVLNDQKDGPLTWVKIGIPNSHVDEIVSGSASIKDIRYYSSGGDYVRIDFHDKYYAGQAVNIDFSFHQSYMYTIDKEKGVCNYSFTPGWFEEIDVDNIAIYWLKKDVVSSTFINTEDEYLVTKQSLKAGKRVSVSVNYDLSTFSLDEGKQATNSGGSRVWIIIIIVVAAVALIIFVCYLAEDYHSGSGFGGGSHTHVYHSSCARSSCACVSSCACACACAGGGRAGCSKKDFYSNKVLKVKDLKKALK